MAPARRALIVIIGAVALGGASSSQAQQSAGLYRIGFLGTSSPSGYASQLQAFRGTLRELGYVEGKNLVIEFRWAQGKYERLPALAAELVRLKPDVLVTHSPPGALAAKQATNKIPIVIGVIGEAVAVGVVQSLARPGGNVTGSSFFVPELNAKRLEILREVLPRLRRIGFLLRRDNQVNVPVLATMERAARALNIELHHVEVGDPATLEEALLTLVNKQVDALVVFDEAVLVANAEQIASLAAKHRLPSIGFIEYARSGGLMAFGVNFADMWRRAAINVDKILKGVKPADLPVEQAATFELIVNQRTARALGLTIPSAILLRATQVIE